MAALLLQLLHQALVVVALLVAAEWVEAGLPLAHPKMGPALGKLGNPAPFHRCVEPQQLGELIFCFWAVECDSLAITQLAGATSTGKPFA